MSVDAELYEAAELDGANKFQQFRYIILPSIKTIVTLNVILAITGSLSAFEQPFVITTGANGTGTYFIIMNKIAHTSQKVGLASAMAVVLLLIILICAALQKLFFEYIFKDSSSDDESYKAKKLRKKLHKQLFDLCGFALPKYAHIAPIMKLEVTVDEEGEHQRKRKLSKRKDPEAAVGFYAEQGFPSVSVLEYLMTIANSNYEEWHAAHADKTIDDFTLSLKKMPVSGALFDMVKLNDVSKEMISKLTAEECYDLIMEWAKEHDENIYTFGTQDKDGFMKTINLWKMSGKKVRKDVGKWSDLRAMFGYLYTPEDELDLQYEIDEKYTPEMITEVIEEYKKDLFLDSEDWFSSMKVMGEKIGYCPNVKEYKQNPDGYKGSITDVCTIVRVAITGKQNSPDLFTIMNVIGKDKTVGRLDKFLAWVNR